MTLTHQRLRTPRAAAVAGILFAILYDSGLLLIRIAMRTDIAGETTWMKSNSRLISLALNLVPYAGIAFLWFIGVIRDRLGDLEDRFFASVSLGSGLLFLGLTFIGAAMAGGMLSSLLMIPEPTIEKSLYLYSREVMYNPRSSFPRSRSYH